MLVCLAWAASAVTSTAWAQSRYVSDELRITLRTGPSTQNAIVRELLSGEVVTILEQNADTGYARVRTANGTEGWVLTRYLTDTPIARDRLVDAERALGQARSRVTELEATVADLTERLGTTTQRLDDAETATTNLNAELVDVRGASANALTIRDQNESLRRRLNERDQLVETLTMENAQLASRESREWFVLGAGVLVAGIVLGLIIPSLRKRRRTDW